MNRPLANDESCTTSRAASVNSRAARWPLDILDVSMSASGSSAASLALGSAGGDLVSIIRPSLAWIKTCSGNSHVPQERARLKMNGAGFHEAIHRVDEFRGADSIRMTQRSAAERS